MTWRPKSGWTVEHTDSDLAKIGLIVALESQAKYGMWMISKAVCGLTNAEWQRWEARQLKQIVEGLEKAATDRELGSHIIAFDAARVRAHDLRHQVAHAFWGFEPEQNRVVAHDVRRDSKISSEDIDAAVEGMADLTWKSKACVLRTAQLICDGALPEGAEQAGGPRIRLNDRWVRL